MNLEPFLYAGRLYMAEAGYAELYRKLLRDILPSFGGEGVFVTKYLYGSAILCPRDFELVLRDKAQMRREKRLASSGKDEAALKKSQRMDWVEAMLAIRAPPQRSLTR